MRYLVSKGGPRGCLIQQCPMPTSRELYPVLGGCALQFFTVMLQLSVGEPGFKAQGVQILATTTPGTTTAMPRLLTECLLGARPLQVFPI